MTDKNNKYLHIKLSKMTLEKSFELRPENFIILFFHKTSSNYLRGLDMQKLNLLNLPF